VAKSEDALDLESSGSPFAGQAPCGFKSRQPHTHLSAKGHTMKRMSRAGDPISIPLDFDTAMSGLMKVKPTEDMPRSDYKKPTAKKKAARKKRAAKKSH
jgi:hypothetical protein